MRSCCGRSRSITASASSTCRRGIPRPGADGSGGTSPTDLPATSFRSRPRTPRCIPVWRLCWRWWAFLPRSFPRAAPRDWIRLTLCGLPELSVFTLPLRQRRVELHADSHGEVVHRFLDTRNALEAEVAVHGPAAAVNDFRRDACAQDTSWPRRGECVF